MADEAQQDRTEQATPKRREDARKKGDVPRSRELTMTGVMLSGAGGLLLLSAPMGKDLLAAFGQGFVIEREVMFDPALMGPGICRSRRQRNAEPVAVWHPVDPRSVLECDRDRRLVLQHESRKFQIGAAESAQRPEAHIQCQCAERTV